MITLDFAITESDRSRGWRRMLDDALKEIPTAYVDVLAGHPHATIHVIVSYDDEVPRRLPDWQVD